MAPSLRPFGRTLRGIGERDEAVLLASLPSLPSLSGSPPSFSGSCGRIRGPVPNRRRMTSSAPSVIGCAAPAGRTLSPVARKLAPPQAEVLWPLQGVKFGELWTLPSLGDHCPLMRGAPMPNKTQKNPQMFIKNILVWRPSAECVLPAEEVPTSLPPRGAEAWGPWTQGPWKVSPRAQVAVTAARLSALPGPFLAEESACRGPLRGSADWEPGGPVSMSDSPGSTCQEAHCHVLGMCAPSWASGPAGVVTAGPGSCDGARGCHIRSAITGPHVL